MSIAEATETSLSGLSPTFTDTLRQYVERYREEFRGDLDGGQSAVEAARKISRAMDGVLGAMFCASEALCRTTGLGAVQLLAVGGYGRKLLGPHSDLDLVFLCEDPKSPAVQRLTELFLHPLWDVGLEVGHAVRSREDYLSLARKDLATTTTLLDMRHVAGDSSLLADLTPRVRRASLGQVSRLLKRLTSDVTSRHERFGASIYLLEPEVKLGPGGLRDLDVALWAAKARWKTGLSGLLKHGILSPSEVESIRHAREFLWQVRGRLHLATGRKQDRLTFSDQEEIAYHMGFVDGVALAVEQFMQAYYRHAHSIKGAVERIVERAEPKHARTQRPPLRPIRRRGESGWADTGLALFDGALTFLRRRELDKRPALALEFFRELTTRMLPPYPRSVEAIVRAAENASWAERLRNDPEAARLFLGLLCSGNDPQPTRFAKHSITEALHAVRLTTVLIPEIAPLVGRVIHDVYHVHTFDLHAIRAVDRLRSLSRGQHIDKLRLASRLSLEHPSRAALLIAALLHPVGRIRGTLSDEQLHELVTPILRRLGFREEERHHIEWLLRMRDSFYNWATKRDTSDPAVLAELAEIVAGEERLRDLYLLTVAVVSTTNQTALTSWKARVLDELYLSLASHLRGDGSNRAAALRRDVEARFVGDVEAQALSDLTARLPDRYFLANSPDAIAHHARSIRDATSPLVVALGPGPSEGVSELLISTADQPGLLSSVCAALSANGIGVVGAQVYTLEAEDTGAARAFDVFWVRRAQEGSAQLDGVASRLNERNRRNVERDLRALLEGELEASVLLNTRRKSPSWASQKRPNVETLVSLDQSSTDHTIVEVVTRDRVGVLHVIANTLAAENLTISLAKVNTEGLRVADVFYVAENDKRLSAARGEEVRSALMSALRNLHTQSD